MYQGSSHAPFVSSTNAEMKYMNGRLEIDKANFSSYSKDNESRYMTEV